jgi:predicted heme/steroid binding protein
MNHTFKSGDLVVIVGANSLTQNIGKQCELREYVTEGDCYVAPNGEVYRHSDVPCWTLIGDGLVAVIEDDVVDLGFGLHEPRHLMPIGGNLTLEQLRIKELES